MTVTIIPVSKLSANALQGVAEEFISRSGTDYGAIEASWETKVKQVKEKLKGLFLHSAILCYIIIGNV
jgi:hypothetical protein